MVSLLDSAGLKKMLAAVSLRWLAVGQRTIEAYERLIRNQADNEPAFQEFFEAHPLLLDPLAFRVWPKPDLSGYRVPDFVLARTDDSYLVIEIETLGKGIMIRNGQLSSKATHAVAQATEYRSFLMDRFERVRGVFSNFHAPDALVVIGLERSLTTEQQSALRRENEQRAHLAIVSFDTLAARASAIAQNLVKGRVKIERGRLI